MAPNGAPDVAPNAAPNAAPLARSQVARAIVLAGTVSLIGAASIVLLAGVLGQTAGLLAATALTGIAVGWAMRGTRGSLATSTRLTVALLFALDAVAIGNVGTWAYALSEGGVLGLVDYLLEAFGPLVPAEAVVAGTAAAMAAK